MKTQDFEDFKTLLQGVYDFYGKDLSRFSLDIWWNAMRTYEMPVISRAFSMHCTNPDTGQFCPKPADVVRMVGGTTRDAALMGWNKVQEAVSRVGSYRSVCFDDPIINRILVDMGGWPGICVKQMDELPFVERNFCDRYRAYKTHGGAPGHTPYLVGLAEAQNAQGGFRSEPPMLVGNADEARRVLEGGSKTALIPVTIGDHLNSGIRLVGGVVA